MDNLRSPYDQVGGIVYFGRMLDKIRLHEAGLLPPDYIPNLGSGFDDRCVRFLDIEYDILVNRVKEGGTDDDLLEWCFRSGQKPTTEQIEVWNEYMRKRGWNDSGSARLRERLQEGNYGPKGDGIHTFFDYIDLDEGRL